jgi:glycolate oxidase FAD binding subunit
VTRDLRGVIEYRPGDLVITVGAGTTLAELAQVTSEHAQHCALWPYGDDSATVGALIATAGAAPLALDNYVVRDLVLGLQVVTGTGDVIRAGGRVVKNVAGFDLVRLHTGAFGTLGVITEVSLRLHARPAVDMVRCGVVADGDDGALDDLLPRLVAVRAPLPMLLRLAPDVPSELWVRVAGNTSRAAALNAQVATLGVPQTTEVHEDALHRRVRQAPPDAVVLRARTFLSDAVPFVRAARDAFPTATLLYDPAHGSLRVVLPSVAIGTLERDVATWYRLAAARGAMHTMSVVVDQGRSLAHPFNTPRTALDEGMKRVFDPRGVLNPLAPVSNPRLAHPDV